MFTSYDPRRCTYTLCLYEYTILLKHEKYLNYGVSMLISVSFSKLKNQN